MWRRVFLYGGLAVCGRGRFRRARGGRLHLFAVTRDLPSVEALQNYQPPVTTRVYAGNGTVLGEYARERRIFVPIALCRSRSSTRSPRPKTRISTAIQGIDPSGIMRAAVKDVFNVLQHRRPEGASTITQQVARNFLLNSDVKFSRKIKEAILAIRIDSTYSKDKILELYLNEIFSARIPMASRPRR
jgi:penicillin-binding protein 1A